MTGIKPPFRPSRECIPAGSNGALCGSRFSFPGVYPAPYLQKPVQFYTRYPDRGFPCDSGQTGHFNSSGKNAYVRYWEAKLRVNWGAAWSNRKNRGFTGKYQSGLQYPLFPGTTPRIPPLGRFSSPKYRGIMWQWQWRMVWPAAAPTFISGSPEQYPVSCDALHTLRHCPLVLSGDPLHFHRSPVLPYPPIPSIYPVCHVGK
jgi:hypothetical protein